MTRRIAATARHIALIGGAVALAVILAGCGGSKPTGTGALSNTSASPSAAASGSPSTTPSATATVTGTAPAPAPYPSNYAQAILAAWKAKDTTRLALLTSSSIANHLINDLGSVDQHWVHIRDDGAMGSTYATYYNEKGDLLIIRMGNEALSQKKYHAGAIETYDKMAYPNDAKAYVKKFVDAWLDGNAARMRLLSSDSVTTHFLGLTMPDSDYTVGDGPDGGSAGHVEIEISEATVSLDQNVLVATPVLGGPHAIENCFPSCG
jgi:hypothetical protein